MRQVTDIADEFYSFYKYYIVWSFDMLVSAGINTWIKEKRVVRLKITPYYLCSESTYFLF